MVSVSTDATDAGELTARTPGEETPGSPLTGDLAAREVDELVPHLAVHVDTVEGIGAGLFRIVDGPADLGPIHLRLAVLGTKRIVMPFPERMRQPSKAIVYEYFPLNVNLV